MLNKKQVLKGIGVIIAITIIVCVGHGLLSGNTQILTVMSDSMSPTINAGDMVVIKTIDPTEISVGDIVTYAPRTYGIVITHRVIDIEENGNFVMRGDANEKNDISAIKPEQVIGRCDMTIPYFGYVAHNIRKPIGFMILIVVPALLLLGIELKDIWMRSKSEVDGR